MNNRSIVLLDFLELIISIIGFVIFSILFLYINEKQRFLFLLASIYLLYNAYKKSLELKVFNRKDRIIKYNERKINI